MTEVQEANLRWYIQREIRGSLQSPETDAGRIEVALNVLYYLDGGDRTLGPEWAGHNEST